MVTGQRVLSKLQKRVLALIMLVFTNSLLNYWISVMKTLPPHSRNITTSEPSLRDRIIERARGGVLPILASLGIVMTGCAPGPKPDMGGKYTFATPEIMRSGEFPVSPLVSKGTFCSGALVSFQGQDYISTIAHCIPGIVYQ